VNLRAVKVAVLSLLLCLSSGMAVVRAQTAASEYQVKAAFLYNFIKFIEWPAGTFVADDSPITIGVVGENSIGGDLAATVKGKTVNGRPLVIKSFGSAKDAGLKNCQMVFIAKSERKRIDEIMAALKGTSVLTVSESEGFLDAGGMINFVMEGNRVRFEINDAAVKQSGLLISSKLLSLSKRREHSP